MKHLQRKLKKAKIKDEDTSELFLSIFDGMSGGFAYCELIVDSAGKPKDYRFILVNRAFEKQSSRDNGTTIGKTCREINPDVEQSWIDKLGAVVIDQKPNHFTDYNPKTNR